jgi:hypothetical protein
MLKGGTYFVIKNTLLHVVNKLKINLVILTMINKHNINFTFL